MAISGTNSSFKIKNSGYKNLKFVKLFGVIAAIPAIIKIISKPEIFIGAGNVLDYFIVAYPIIMFLAYRRNINVVSNQFIDFNDDSVTYKTRNKKPVKVMNADISDIRIELDEIHIQTFDSEWQKVSIEDFAEVSERTSIKDNFKKLRKGIECQDVEEQSSFGTEESKLLLPTH